MLSFKKINWLSLQPRENSEKKLFWAFKMKNVRLSIWFEFGIIFLSLVYALIRFAITRNMEDFLLLVLCLFTFFLWIFILWISKRSDLFVYLIPICRIFINALYFYRLEDYKTESQNDVSNNG